MMSPIIKPNSIEKNFLSITFIRLILFTVIPAFKVSGEGTGHGGMKYYC